MTVLERARRETRRLIASATRLLRRIRHAPAPREKRAKLEPRNGYGG